MIFALNFVLAMYLTLAYHNFHKQTSDYFSTFRKEYSCAPSVEELLKSNLGWRKGSSGVVRKFYNWGGGYTITYHQSQDGMGYLTDEEKLIGVQLPACLPAIGKPVAEKQKSAENTTP